MIPLLSLQWVSRQGLSLWRYPEIDTDLSLELRAHAIFWLGARFIRIPKAGELPMHIPCCYPVDKPRITVR